MAFYEVTLNGEYAGQDVKNILWYRNATPFADAEEFFGLLSALCAQVEDEIWASTGPSYTLGRGLRDVLPEGYVLQSISAVGYGDGFDLLNDTPFTRVINQAGLVPGATNGPASAVILKANLEPSFGSGIGLPKRGFLVIGPTLDATVPDTGILDALHQSYFNEVGVRLAANVVTVLPPAIFFPIRVRVTRLAHIVTLITYKDVSGFVCNPVATWRKSRQPES
jgi:hypothetical protein